MLSGANAVPKPSRNERRKAAKPVDMIDRSHRAGTMSATVDLSNLSPLLHPTADLSALLAGKQGRLPILANSAEFHKFRNPLAIDN